MRESLKSPLNKLAKVIVCLSLVLTSSYTYGTSAEYIYTLRHDSDYVKERVRQIYNDIVVSSGQSDRALPLEIVESDQYNAYTDGTKIVIYTGLINVSSYDTIAYVLGHELAHYHLEHTGRLGAEDNETSQRHEALADKMGASYMLKAGYNICHAREGWKQIKEQYGDSLGGTHPNYAYRFDQLDYNCHWYNSF